MEFWSKLLFLSNVLTFILNTAAQTDLTIRPKAYGLDVVNAVNSKIQSARIFLDDKRFLVRLAHVETKFGNDAKTYRPNYHGGIWQIDENLHEMTKDLGPNPRLMQNVYKRIQEKFGINWTQTTWQDLEKPLYSGLALRILMLRIPEVIPDTIAQQAEYWRNYFKPTANTKVFIDHIKFLESQQVCSGRMDLVIVVDSSGSIGQEDFETAKGFVANLTTKFSLKSVRISLIVYSNISNIEIPLNNKLTPEDITAKVMRVTWLNSYTATHLGIIDAINEFSADTTDAKSLHAAVPKVVIVFTDGKSSYPNRTIESATKAKDLGIITFSVGIGNTVSDEELLIIAGNDANHVITSSSYDALTELPYRLNGDTCTIPQKPPTVGTVKDTVIQNETRYFEYALPEEGITIDLGVVLGDAKGFFSYTFNTPSSAVNDGEINGPTFIPYDPLYSNKSHRVSRSVRRPFREVFVGVQGLDETNDFIVETVEGNSVPAKGAASSLTATSMYSFFQVLLPLLFVMKTI